MAAERHALIVGGGSGTRLGSEVPKQFLPLDGIPVIVRTIQTFLAADPSMRTVVVIAKDWMEHFSGLAQEWDLPKGLVTVSGGDTRFQSVRNGLRALLDHDGLVAVHDAVRPLATAELIIAVFEAAEVSGNAVPVVMFPDSVRKVDGEGSSALSRESLRIVQTPQCFGLNDLIAAYEQSFSESFTDCATVMERMGHRLHLIEGDPMNIKITSRDDLQFAQWYLSFGRRGETNLRET